MKHKRSKEMTKYQEFEEFFPIGAKVRCENECFPGKWDYGMVECHKLNRYGEAQWISIRLHDDRLNVDYFADFDYRYLDTNPHNSLVRIVK
jgi:hypothetical protein